MFAEPIVSGEGVADFGREQSRLEEQTVGTAPLPFSTIEGNSVKCAAVFDRETDIPATVLLDLMQITVFGDRRREMVNLRLRESARFQLEEPIRSLVCAIFHHQNRQCDVGTPGRNSTRHSIDLVRPVKIAAVEVDQLAVLHARQRAVDAEAEVIEDSAEKAE